jgi:hypothetical protein
MKKHYTSRVILPAVIFLVAAVVSPSMAAYPMRGEPFFTESTLSPEVQVWYKRYQAASKNEDAHEFSPLKMAQSGDIFQLARPFNDIITTHLGMLRLTGDLRVLDRVDFLMQQARAQLKDAWDDGTTDGFLSWRNYNAGELLPGDYGTDRNRELDEMLAHSVVASVAWAYRQNQDLVSPSGISYKSRADFWQNYLSNHFEKKWRQRNSKPTGFPFLTKTLLHVYSNWIRYHYYMHKLTGRNDYLAEANRLASITAKNMSTVEGTSNYIWEHFVRFDPKSNTNPSSAQPVTYVQLTYNAVLDMGYEGFAQFANSAVMKAYMGGFRDFMLDGLYPLTTTQSLIIGSSCSGELGRWGMRNGTRTFIQVTTTKRQRSLDLGDSIYSQLGFWDSTGKIEKTAEKAYGINEFWYFESPKRIALPAGMCWILTVKSPNSVSTAPSHLKASAPSSTRVNLSWQDNSSNEKGFRIERSVGTSNSFVRIAGVSSNIVTHADTNTVKGEYYYYRVASTNSYGQSMFSQTVKIRTP